ncbi:extracellular solute-binding protein [Streptobacillus felis]|uniref:Extracellular solute-binding protein n=1 Tax=Streptobacillus felis TaxID=1384509 RepID=A0A7Z0TA91_9FUSO|nr:extracellular solute-binding protein [Streptobacillus felis]NYV27757.1 extracellular solute-binding protein [Streptobacillus felis]
MKRLIYLLMFFVLISCGANTEKKEVLNIYTWESFVPDEIFEDFEKETGIKVNVSFYDTNDVMLSKLLSGVKEYDIISPSTDFIKVLRDNDFLEKLDKSKFNNVFENITISKDLLKTYDENLDYTIPYNLFATGISLKNDSVNPKYAEERSLEILLDPEYKSRMTILDDSREVIGMALQYLGYPSDSKNDNELQEAKDLILKWKENIAKFENVTYGKGLTTGEFVAVHGYQDVFYEIDEEEFKEYTYYLPKGAMMYIDTMAILKEAPNKENAYKFLNFLYQPENFVKVLDQFKTPSIFSHIKANKAPILELEYVLQNSTLPNALDDEAKEKQDKIWNEIKVK